MEDISAQTTLVSGHPWPDLREMIHEQVQKARPQIYAVQEVVHNPDSACSVKLSRQVSELQTAARQGGDYTSL